VLLRDNGIGKKFVCLFLKGQISKQGFQAGVREYFDSKNNDDIDALLQGAQEELKAKSEWIDYRLLLSEVK
jgi:hypothetical protein